MRVHSFESLAAVDGDGVRYAVFLAGCPLRCVYCHNADTQSSLGKEYPPEEILKRVKRYKPYFKNRGGVTFSGGEPLLQAKEINEVYSLLKENGINYALDTSICLPLTEEIKECLKGADLVICDLKFYNREDYKRYASCDMDNVIKTLGYLKKINKRVWIRTVIVPDINDRKEDIERYAEIVKNYPNCEKYELLGFHTMGFFKYDELGIENPLKGYKALDSEVLTSLQNYADALLGIE